LRCGQCGASLGEGDRFCGDCGANVGGCPTCGEPLIPGKRFCRSCGLAFPAAPAPAAARPSPAAEERDGEASGPVAERRVCSVLFCDVVGFTPLSEARDPEVVRELLSRYFEVAETVIGRYGGLVEKFIGDAVMAVWGTPIASEEDAERAVRAGLDLVTAVRMLGHEAGVPGLAARAGVVTGAVAVTLSAANQGMVAGDAVNTAEAMLAGLRGNEDAQTKAEISLAEAFIAAAHRQPDEALRHAQDVVALRDARGISHECVRWAWPLTARAAHELGDVALTGALLALLDSYQPGHLAPVLQAERDLTRARLAGRDDGQAADAAFAAAIASLRRRSTPYHLAHGLLDHADHLLGRGAAEGAAAAIEDARGIGTGLRCEPLLTRADAVRLEAGHAC
jgi:class 3 adenylate cyclase